MLIVTTSPDTPMRVYLLRTFLLMSGYVLLNLLAISGVHEASHLVAGILALCITLFIAAHIWAFLVFIRDSDEFIRAVAAKRFIIASGAVVAGFAGWGFCETYAGAPSAPSYLIYAALWLAFAIATPFVKTSHP